MDFYQTPEQDTRPKDKVELQQQKKHEFKFIGRQRTIPGHTMFSFNIETGEIKEASMTIDAAIDAKTYKPVRIRKLQIEKNCVYRQALNRKNFIKRLLREGIVTLRKVEHPSLPQPKD